MKDLIKEVSSVFVFTNIIEKEDVRFMNLLKFGLILYLTSLFCSVFFLLINRWLGFIFVLGFLIDIYKSESDGNSILGYINGKTRKLVAKRLTSELGRFISVEEVFDAYKEYVLLTIKTRAPKNDPRFFRVIMQKFLKGKLRLIYFIIGSVIAMVGSKVITLVVDEFTLLYSLGDNQEMVYFVLSVSLTISLLCIAIWLISFICLRGINHSITQLLKMEMNSY